MKKKGRNVFKVMIVHILDNRLNRGILLQNTCMNFWPMCQNLNTQAQITSAFKHLKSIACPTQPGAPVFPGKSFWVSHLKLAVL